MSGLVSEWIAWVRKCINTNKQRRKEGREEAIKKME